jgi:hypothetical protein
MGRPHPLKNDGFVFLACAYQAKGLAFFGKNIAREASQTSQIDAGKVYQARFLNRGLKAYWDCEPR